MGNKNSCTQIDDLTISMSPTEIKSFFTGTWHEVVRTDVIFERGCENAVAQYKYGDVVQIVNTCWRTKKDKSSSIQMRATKRDANSDKASFNVGITRLETQGYNILYNKNGMSVVAGDSWNNLWVLARNKDVSHDEICRVLSPFSLFLRSQTLIYNSGEKCYLDAMQAPRRILKATRHPKRFGTL
jgi:lipocalin